MKIGKMVFAGLLSGVLMLASAVPAFAAGKNYAVITGGTASFDKYLVMDQEANVPNTTFEFTIAPASSGVSPADGYLEIQPGNAAAVKGSPVIEKGQAAFHVGDTTYTSPQTHLDTGTRQATQPKDNVVLKEDQKYARKQVKVDFTGVTFSEPGVYRWIITESASSQLGIDNDADATRIMDVYVVDSEGELEIKGYVLHNEDDFQPAVSGAAHEPSTGKSVGYSNLYTTYNIDLSKTVTGNQGSRDEYFKFTVTIQGDTEGTKLDVDLSNADPVTLINAYSPTAHNNPSTLTLGKDGSVTQDFWLQNGQSIVINGIPRAASYTITEDEKEYRPSTVTKEGNSSAVSRNSNQVKDNDLEGDTTIDYTNDKTGVIPTNLLIKTGPFLVVAIIGVLGFAALLLGRKYARTH